MHSLSTICLLRKKCFKAKPKTLFVPAKVNLDLLIPVNIYGSNPWNSVRIGLPFLPCFFFLHSRKLQTFWPAEVISGLVMPGLFFFLNLNYRGKKVQPTQEYLEQELKKTKWYPWVGDQSPTICYYAQEKKVGLSIEQPKASSWLLLFPSMDGPEFHLQSWKVTGDFEPITVSRRNALNPALNSWKNHHLYIQCPNWIQMIMSKIYTCRSQLGVLRYLNSELPTWLFHIFKGDVLLS